VHKCVIESNGESVNTFVSYFIPYTVAGQLAQIAQNLKYIQ
jgi:hypothetical protein